jgi:hypothetical protein
VYTAYDIKATSHGGELKGLLNDQSAGFVREVFFKAAIVDHDGTVSGH